jgi:ankyrin repeat protein
LTDALFCPDMPEAQQWLVYYISRPLVGSYDSLRIIPATIRTAAQRAADKPKPAIPSASDVKKKDIASFTELLTAFPLIARQLQNGLDRTLKEFAAQFDGPVPNKSSRAPSVSSQRSDYSSTSLENSLASLRSSVSGSDSSIRLSSLAIEPEEDSMRFALESATTAAIDLFQGVDRQQLSLLGATTDLSGPVVERMIERHIAEQLHEQILFPRICNIRRSEDLELEHRLRKMANIDIAQVGIPIEDGMRGKRDMAIRIDRAVGVFKKMGVASSPQEMIEILLETTKTVTATTSNNTGQPGMRPDGTTEKPNIAMTINADVLVSMLLIVVIRSSVRYMHARLSYMRHFVFIDDVDSGEIGYVLSTFEAVLVYLSRDSDALRIAARKNARLWKATRNGNTSELRSMLQPGDPWSADSQVIEEAPSFDDSFRDPDASSLSSRLTNVNIERQNRPMPDGDFAAVGGSLAHVFPFQKPPTPPPEVSQPKRKRVTMASFRSASVSSGYSSPSRSRSKSIDSTLSTASAGDSSLDKISQSQGLGGDSILMMAVENGQLASLEYLLSLDQYFPIEFILEDCNNEGVTLLVAAVQGDDKNLTNSLLNHIIRNAPSDNTLRSYFVRQDSKGRTFAHYLFNQPHLMETVGEMLPWRLKDKNGQTPLFALCRSYDHQEYRWMVETALTLATDAQPDREPLHLADHIDNKGNTLLHIVNDPHVTAWLLRHCDSDVNAANDKRFTPLMMASKYGRLDLVRTFFGDARVDLQIKDIRGLTAVELAKDDEVRNRIDDLVLLSTRPAADGRITSVVRSFFVEDATVRLVLKSGGPNPNGTITVTTCRRSVADFEHLAKWLSIEQPASWIPTHFNLTSPFLIPSKPSRAVLRDIQLRLDAFLQCLLTHSTFSTHEMVWEFFLVPDIDPAMLAERAKHKAEIRVENVRDDYDPITDTREVESFVSHAKDQLRGVSHAVKSLIRRTNAQRMLNSDLHDARMLNNTGVATLQFLPRKYLTAFDMYTKALTPSESDPLASFYYSLHSIANSSTAVLVALGRPTSLIGSMNQAKRNIERAIGSLTRQSRWTPNIGLFDETRRSIAAEAEEKATKAQGELDSLGSELRYTQQTVAAELAGWQEQHVKFGKRMLKDLAKGMVVKEKARLENMKRALRELQR